MKETKKPLTVSGPIGITVYILLLLSIIVGPFALCMWLFSLISAPWWVSLPISFIIGAFVFAKMVTIDR